MRQHNPAFIPRNHNVEEALLAATSRNDFSVMERLLEVLATPYDHDRDLPIFSACRLGRPDLPYVLRHVTHTEALAHRRHEAFSLFLRADREPDRALPCAGQLDHPRSMFDLHLNELSPQPRVRELH